MMTSRIKPLVSAIHALGPYFLVEVLLPGGTLVALALWTYRQWRSADPHWGLDAGDWGVTRKDVELGLAAPE